MHFVNRDGCVPLLPARAARLQPARIDPFERCRIGHDRGGARHDLDLQCHGVGLEWQQPMRAQNLVFVHAADGQPWNEQLPDTGLDALAHRMAAAVPAVEITDDRDAPCVRRPDREAHTGDVVDAHDLRAQTAAELEVIALGEQVDVELTEQ